MEQVLIISIDETNFRSDTIAKRQWQFKRLNEFDNMLKKKRINRLRIPTGKSRKNRSIVRAKDREYDLQRVKKRLRNNKRHRYRSESNDDEQHSDGDHGSRRSNLT